jgi:hypothetical protein
MIVFAIGDPAVVDHGQRLVDVQLEHLDVLALLGEPAPADTRRPGVGRGEEETRSVTDPGLMKTSNTCSRRPPPHRAPRGLPADRGGGSWSSSSPAAASTSIPSGEPLT